MPFVFYTGFGSRELMLEVLKYGAHDFIEKPNVVELIEAAKTAILAQSDKKMESEEQLSEYKKLLKEKN